MPRPITREQAIARVGLEHTGGCLMCAILAGEAGPVWTLAEAEHAVAVLSRYPRTWGQVMVVLRQHITTFTDLPPEAWAQASALAHTLAARIEVRLKPLRCYVSCLGTWRTDIPMSAGHLHIHIDPVYDPDARPRTVLTLAQGCLEADKDEWQALWKALRS